MKILTEETNSPLLDSEPALATRFKFKICRRQKNFKFLCMKCLFGAFSVLKKCFFGALKLKKLASERNCAEFSATWSFFGGVLELLRPEKSLKSSSRRNVRRIWGGEPARSEGAPTPRSGVRAERGQPPQIAPKFRRLGAF